MKSIQKIAVAGIAGALILASAGCDKKSDSDTSETTAASVSSTESETTEAETSATETTAEESETTASETETEATDAPAEGHVVEVTEVVAATMKDVNGIEYQTVIPKLTVDGQEATEINETLGSYIQKTYPLEENGDYVDGYETSFSYGVKDNMVSIVISANYLTEDFGVSEVYNYDLDTLTELENSEVVKRLGMSDDEFFGKVEDVYTAYCEKINAFDLDKSIELIGYDKVKPYITSDGNIGVLGCLVYSEGQQFDGETFRCFEL